MVEIKNINQGGLADSDYIGAKYSVAEAVGLDIHSESGVIKVNQKLTAEDTSALTTNELSEPTIIVPSSNGSTYFFGKTSGKVWKRTAGGTWSYLQTCSPAAGSAGVLSAMEYQSYIYYAMESRLGRMAISSDSFSDSWATFSNTDDTYHPMKKVNQVIYIGDGNYVAQVDAGVYTADALDLKDALRISALGKLDTDLLIGTYVSDNVNKTEILRWNTWSVSYSVSDEIPEVGVYCFIETDNIVLVAAGTKGNLYIYDGAQLEMYKRIKGTWTGSNKAIVKNEASINFHGLPLFGVSNVSGNACHLGLYSIGRTNRNYPYILNLEFPISTGSLADVLIHSVAASGDVFFVSWEDDGTYGVDMLDLTAKQTSAYYTSMVLVPERHLMTTYGIAHVPYRNKPTNTDINLYAKVDYGSFAELTDTVDDTVRHMLMTNSHVGEASALQIKTELVSSGNTAPEVEGTIIAI